MCEEEHGDEVGDAGDGDEGRREGAEEDGGGAEAVLEVGGGCEEHVPVLAVRSGFFLYGRDREDYQAQSMEMPRRRKMAYSSHEKRCVCFLW